MAGVIRERRGQLGILRLDRPQKLNALNHEMIREIRAALEDWAGDTAISAVVVTGEGPRAFCAGGDIRGFRDSALAGGKEVCAFWRDEYALIGRIATYPKPYIALMHGIAMGGGLGLSVPGKYRIAADNVLCAMPECGIGFFPDVGASFFLSRAPGALGMYMALTGARLFRADAHYAGLVTHGLNPDAWPALLDALAAGKSVDQLLPNMGINEVPLIAAHQGLIDRVFSAASVEEVLARLDAEGDDFARAAASAMRARSPTSLKITFRAVRLGRKASFAESLRADLRIACHMQALPDFAEGIRTTVVDKKDSPAWQPATLSEVAEDVLEDCFQPLAEGDLEV